MSERNPAGLTPKQVGVAEGWRLLNEDEYGNYSDAIPCQCWLSSPQEWIGTYWFPLKLSGPYRTKLSPAELRKARGLPEVPPVGAAGEELVEIPLSEPTPEERKLIDAVTSATLWKDEADELRAQVRALEGERDAAVAAYGNWSSTANDNLALQLAIEQRDSLRAENARLKAEVDRLRALS